MFALMPGCARQSAGDFRLKTVKGNLSRKLAQQRAGPAAIKTELVVLKVPVSQIVCKRNLFSYSMPFTCLFLAIFTLPGGPIPLTETGAERVVSLSVEFMQHNKTVLVNQLLFVPEVQILIRYLLLVLDATTAKYFDKRSGIRRRLSAGKSFVCLATKQITRYRRKSQPAIL